MKLLSSPAIDLKLATDWRLWRIENWCNHPVAAQRAVLQALVHGGHYTLFGTEIWFHQVVTAYGILKEFVPIS
jgi:hypothetical protein